MGLFREIAEPLVARGVPVIPLRPKTKIAFMPNWQELATTDPVKVNEWDTEDPEYNGACVAFARPDGYWFLEIDQAGYAAQIEKQTGQKIPETFMVRSSPGRGHYYFKQTPASIAMGNAQGKDSEGKESWSARVDCRYVVAPGSMHPTSGKKYETLRDVPIIPAPDWLVEWCGKSATKAEKTGHAELDDETPIGEGGRNSALASIGGKARQVLSMDKEQLYSYLSDVNQKRCKPPLPDSEVRTIANSIGRYEVKPAPGVVMGGRVLGQEVAAVQTQEIVPVQFKPVGYPTFPRWVIDGTSIGEGFVKPICAQNSRYPEFMFMPAMTIVLNYLGQKVSIVDKQIIPSFYMVSIGRKGQVIKSSSVQDAIDYLSMIGIVEQAGNSTKMAAGKSLIWTAGSPEGLGLDMNRTACKNAVLFYDELSELTKKAGIESSTLTSKLLAIYESAKFSNTVKSRKETYSHDPKTYTVSLIACTTDKNFQKLWSVMSGGSSGLDDRFFFLYQPEVLIPLKPYKYVNTVEATVETKKRIDKAVQQGQYVISDDTMLEANINKLGNRTYGRVEKMALFFAVDMGKDEIDESCVERALAIARYELAVKNYLKTFESTTKDGALQQEIIQLLQRSGGSVTTRELDRALHPERHGTYMWERVYRGLINAGWIVETGSGAKGNPKQVLLMRLPEEDD